jgi:hypothetical protein
MVKKRRISILRILVLLVAVGAGAASLFLFIFPSAEQRRYSRMLSVALVNARSVTLVEFDEPFFDGELVFKRVQASAAQIESIRDATKGWFERIRLRASCFKPHHRIEVIRADGSEFRFDICFQCNNFVAGDSRANPLPPDWRVRFEGIFTLAGMPPLKDYRERSEKHPDYPRLYEKFSEIDRTSHPKD